MTDGDRTDAIAALKRVRARLESALHADANGQARRRNDVDASGSRDEAKMASNPVYKSWTLVGEAIEALSAVEDTSTSAIRVDRRAEGATDDLTSIRGIDAALARHLASLGVTRFADIAAWRSDDVHNVAQALGISRDISRQNWIEQAALLERRKAKSEIATAAPAREHVSDLRPELQEIVEAARKDAPAHDDAPSLLALELASQTLGERADATVAVPSPAFEERVAPLRSGSGAEPRVDQRDAASADQPALVLKFAPQHGAPIPVVAISAPANTDATERARRLADARLRLAQSAELADSEHLHDVDEAAVTFVIREPERAQALASSTPRAKPDLRNRLASTSGGEPGMASYVASKGVAEEAEVVVVKPKVRHGAAKRPEGGPVRRFLKALTGG